MQGYLLFAFALRYRMLAANEETNIPAVGITPD